MNIGFFEVKSEISYAIYDDLPMNDITSSWSTNWMGRVSNP